VIPFNTASKVYFKIIILTSKGVTKLRFLRLIIANKILLFIVPQSQDQGITRRVQNIKIRCFDPFPDKIIQLFTTFFCVPSDNQSPLNSFYSMLSTILKDNFHTINTDCSSRDHTNKVAVDNNSLRVRFIGWSRGCYWQRIVVEI
jgi:hypothetical protein